MSGKIRFLVWGTASGNAEAPSTRVPDPRDAWRKNTTFKVATYPVGRLKYFRDMAASRQSHLEPDALVADAT